MACKVKNNGFIYLFSNLQPTINCCLCQRQVSKALSTCTRVFYEHISFGLRFKNIKSPYAPTVFWNNPIHMQPVRRCQAHAKPKRWPYDLTHWPIRGLKKAYVWSDSRWVTSEYCLQYKVDRMQENSIWRFWSTVYWESRSTFIQTHVKKGYKVQSSTILVWSAIYPPLLRE